jgi:PilZ domain
MWTTSRAGRTAASRSRIPWDSPGRADRRKSIRYPIRMKMRFTMPRPEDGGQRVIRSVRSIDMSRHGILFTSPEPLAVGQTMEGSIAWPVPQAGGIPVKLEVKGAVVRSESGRIALEIVRYEFRAARATAPLARAEGSSQ